MLGIKKPSCKLAHKQDVERSCERDDLVAQVLVGRAGADVADVFVFVACDDGVEFSVHFSSSASIGKM